jgi:hypothetical protein
VKKARKEYRKVLREVLESPLQKGEVLDEYCPGTGARQKRLSEKSMV